LQKDQGGLLTRRVQEVVSNFVLLGRDQGRGHFSP
jgi:hypothetical protein